MDYSVSNNTPKIFEIIEYKFSFKTQLSLDILRIKSINLFFNNSDRNKAFFESQFSISKENNLDLFYKILIKDSDKHLKLKSVRFELLASEEQEQSIYLEINVKTEKEKVISLKDSSLNVLEFKYLKNISIGTNQYYTFECEISKTDDSIEADCVTLRFVINEDEDNYMTKSTINIPKHKSSKSHIDFQSSSAPNLLIEEVNIQHTQDESNLAKSFNSLNLVEHEIITKSVDGSLIKHQNSVVIRASSIKCNSPVKCRFLLKFADPGQFTIKFDADYKIMKKEIYDDTSNLRYNGLINVEVKAPFNIKHEFYSETYMSLHLQKIYCVDKLIKLNMLLHNNLDFDGEVNNIIIIAKSDDVKIQSPLTNILVVESSNQDSQFTIQKKGCEFVIPFTLKCTNQFSGSLGKFKILWRDSILKSFDASIFNETEIMLPEINIKKFDINLEYSVPTTLPCKQEVPFKILIVNHSEEFKRLVFLIDTSSSYVTSGQVKKKILLYPNEKKEIILPLIPVHFGRLKLPLFKIMEFPLASSTYENKIYSVYMIPEYVIVN